jgi:chemotaxis protein MotB
MSDEAHPHEIIIIKRHGGGHDDGHHGGAWKIAYADFVTAMMAFFLVMWLLSANEKTKAAIVKYFNPIQLVESTPQPPGLGDPSEKAPSPKKTSPKPTPDKDVKDAKEAGAAKEAESKEPEAKESAKGAAASAKADESKKEESKKDDAALFRDPYAALTEIGAKDAPPSRGGTKAPNDGNKGGAGTAAAAEGQGGDAFRDPFDPVAMAPRGDIEGAAEAGRGESAAHPASEPQPPAASPATAAPAAEPAGAASSAPLPADPTARAAELRTRIETLLKSVAAASSGPQPRIDVKATAEGVLIGLTDDAKFSMFAIASAEPSPRTVTLMEKIGHLLKAQKGQIVLRGYTDSRKYRSTTYDNWRLSSARADMAHYMLVRGGVDDARFERIEGYADRKPRNAKDPESPENRRIEILLRNTP